MLAFSFIQRKNRHNLTAIPEARMDRLFRFPTAIARDPAVERWMQTRPETLRPIARHWFEVMRQCGSDVRELLHDGHPTACAGDAAFGYVNAFTTHVNVGFFRGADLADPAGLLQGTGKRMRHVNVTPGELIDEVALAALIAAAYADMQARLASAHP